MPSPNLRGMKRTSRARVGPVVYQSHTDLGQQEGLILQVTLDTCQEPESGCSRQRLGPTNEVCRWEVGEASWGQCICHENRAGWAGGWDLASNSRCGAWQGMGSEQASPRAPDLESKNGVKFHVLPYPASQSPEELIGGKSRSQTPSSLQVSTTR